MRDLQSIEEFHTIKLAEDVVFLFTAGWCPDCHFIDPFMNEIEEKFDEKFTFISVDRDQFIDLCAEYDIYGIPSFLAFKNGLEVGRLVSKDRKTQEEIENFLSELV
ncbi:thioredoxin family protein [Paenisporosarcina sp. TG20]|uniref:thioredoxin family protein n=1 Tax=Paenisporosarcina sp. TG20 TaxID=1211706 RepID=UPI0002DCE96C|nr:thioredoxin family protein [Paenisporosarcina sp. TG20]